MLETRTSRTGLPIPYWNGHPLHSTYDPVKEARRYIDRNLQDTTPPRVLVIVGAARGYLAKAARERIPDAHVISVFLHESLFRAADTKSQWAWHPGSHESLGAFLMRHIDESDLDGLSILEWTPAILALAAEAAGARDQIRTLITRLKANFATTVTMGRLWIRNTVANFVSLPQTILTITADSNRPLVIAGSGPSLEHSVKALAEVRSRCDVWALPSAVGPLLEQGVRPDLIVQTDPGTYASWHLHPAQGKQIPVAMPLSSARGVWRATNRIHLIRQPYLFEQAFLRSIGCLSSPVVAPQGTVAATAYGLATHHGYKTIIFGGLDFCFRDILSHARPSLFDSYHLSRESRVAPNHGWMFTQAVERAPSRLGPYRTSPALDAYAGWFAEVPSRERIYRLNPVGRALTPMKVLQTDALNGLIGELARASGPTVAMAVDRESIRRPANLKDIAVSLLDAWIADLRALDADDPSSWDAGVRELCHFADLRRLSRLKSSLDLLERKELIASVTAFLGSARARLTETGSPRIGRSDL